MTADPFTAQLTAATAPMRAGDKAAGRVLLQALWDRVAGDPIYECVCAHHMADAQDDPKEELAWDLRALEAAMRCGEFDTSRHTIAIASFMPSLHVNLAEDYFKLGDREQSRASLALARESVVHLPDDAYGQLIRGGIERLERRMGSKNS